MSVHAGSKWIETNWATLPQGFWVAADATHIVAEDRDLTNVYAALVRLQVSLGLVTIVYVPMSGEVFQ